MKQPSLFDAARHRRKCSARFFVRVGQAGRARSIRDPFTRPLFSLALILDAEGMLAAQARQLVTGAG